jgi:hypothetical protein
VIAALTYFPLFGMLAKAVNPDLSTFITSNQITVSNDPANCHVNIFVGPWSKFGDCDKANDFLTKSGLSFTTIKGAPGSVSTLTIGASGTPVTGFSPFTWSKALIDAGYPLLKAETSTVALDKAQADQLAALQAEKKTADVMKLLNDARIAADATAKKLVPIANVDGVALAADGTGAATVTLTEIAQGSADKAKINWPLAIGILFIMMIYVTMVYGPIAAFLVELFPTRIRYTSMSLPYHIGNGWFGGMLPLLATAIVASTGNIYAGLWYPIIIALITAVVGYLFLKDTKDVNIAD